jgi:ABC-type glycerol-3-phosphate transport system substrate-binding protein
MKYGIRRSIAISFFALIVSACGGGGGGGSSASTTTLHTVNISWIANREAAVNSAGGGYTVAISGQSPINVPYVSGAAAPTTVAASLASGSYSATVTAYSALNPPGGTSGSKSIPSTTIAFVVP